MQDARHEPPLFEVLLTRAALLFGASLCREFALGLSLFGHERVLDFGCGMGAAARQVARLLPRGRLTCLDGARRWIAACRRTLSGYGNVDFFEGQIYDLPVPEGYFDVVYCHLVLHDIDDKALCRILPALARCLTPGGVFVFREPLREAQKLTLIRRLAVQSGLIFKDGRVTDMPLMGAALESRYLKP